VLKTVGKYAPPPPGVPPPAQWGDEAIVRERLRDGVADLQTTKRMCPIKYPFPPPEVVEFFKMYFGPVNRAKTGGLRCGATWSSCGQRTTAHRMAQRSSRENTWKSSL
jgi:hypothetical protein